MTENAISSMNLIYQFVTILFLGAAYGGINPHDKDRAGLGLICLMSAGIGVIVVVYSLISLAEIRNINFLESLRTFWS